MRCKWKTMVVFAGLFLTVNVLCFLSLHPWFISHNRLVVAAHLVTAVGGGESHVVVNDNRFVCDT